ncbi:MAG: alanine dehydrogenase [Alphaproteobacteria bacterium]|nr:MAG: alanine dehydrogenase [Alphaproteobacteria bacterium]
MDKQLTNIGIIRESRNDENRTPLVPEHIKKYKESNPNINFIIQPSNSRCFSDEEYELCGAKINENLNECSIIFGVKEIDPNILINNRTYLFFSHTFKINKQQKNIEKHKKDLLLSILNKKITLIDYENIRGKNGTRCLGFGRFAGIVGCYNTLNLLLKVLGKQSLASAYKINDYERLVLNLKNLYFPKTKILVTGDGRVAKGVIELLNLTNIKAVSKKDFLEKKFDQPIFCNLETKDYVTNNSSTNFNLEHFINNPQDYSSSALQYLKETDILISAHYWDPSSPKIFENEDLKVLQNLKIVGDITCDINGSVPTTIRSTTIEEPNYWIERYTLKEIDENNDGIAVMAVDNLPSELPRDSSTEFSEGIINEVLPFLLKEDDGRILNGTITTDGSFLEKYNYLNDYIRINE